MWLQNPASFIYLFSNHVLYAYPQDTLLGTGDTVGNKIDEVPNPMGFTQCEKADNGHILVYQIDNLKSC